MTNLHPRAGYRRRRCCLVPEFGHLGRTDQGTLTMVASHPSMCRVECYTRLTLVVVILHSHRTYLSSKTWS